MPGNRASVDLFPDPVFVNTFAERLDDQSLENPVNRLVLANQAIDRLIEHTDEAVDDRFYQPLLVAEVVIESAPRYPGAFGHVVKPRRVVPDFREGEHPRLNECDPRCPCRFCCASHLLVSPGQSVRSRTRVCACM